MSDDKERQGAATSRDLSRHAATTPDSDFSLSIEEALVRYEAAGLPRTPRSIQRYCAKGHLEARRIETSFGEKFLISPASIDRHIAYIKEVRPVATGRGVSRQVATDVAGKNKDEEQQPPGATSSDQPRQAATDKHVSGPVAAEGNTLSRYVERLEGENEFLRKQVAVKDEQIGALLERDRETNLLINGLQRMLGPLLAAPDREQDHRAGGTAVERS